MTGAIRWDLLIECEPEKNCAKCDEARKAKQYYSEIRDELLTLKGYNRCQKCKEFILDEAGHCCP